MAAADSRSFRGDGSGASCTPDPEGERGDGTPLAPCSPSPDAVPRPPVPPGCEWLSALPIEVHATILEMGRKVAVAELRAEAAERQLADVLGIARQLSAKVERYREAELRAVLDGAAPAGSA